MMRVTSIFLFILALCVAALPCAEAAKKKRPIPTKPMAQEAAPVPPPPPPPSGPQPVLIKGHILNPTAGTETAFLYENIRTEEGSKTISRTRYSDLSGKSLVEEENIYDSGKFHLYSYNQLQTNEHGTIEVKDGKVFFSFTSGEKTSTDDKSFTDNMVSADMLQDKIRANWETIAKGDNLQTRFLVLEAQDDFGFKIFKDHDTTYGDKPALILTMKASGFFVSLAAPVFHITVEKDEPHRLLRIDGRLPIRIPKKTPVVSRSDLKAMDGTLILEYPSAQVPAASSSPASGAASSVAPAPREEEGSSSSSSKGSKAGAGI